MDSYEKKDIYVCICYMLLQVSISKTKDIAIDFRSLAMPPPSVIEEIKIHRVSSYKYLDVQLNKIKI